jgi:hypothetical protein
LYVLPTPPLKAGSAIGRAVLKRVVELDAIFPPVGVPRNDEANHQGGSFHSGGRRSIFCNDDCSPLKH